MTLTQQGIAVLAIVATVLIPTEAVAEEKRKPSECSTALYSKLAAKGFSPRRWRDPSPLRKQERRKLMRTRRCALTRIAREKMKRIHRNKRRRFHAHFLDLITAPGPSYLRRLRHCESGSHGLYEANTGNGFSGAYQFTPSTWRSVGGRGMAHNNVPREQDYRAAKLYRREGSGPWPVCG